MRPGLLAAGSDIIDNTDRVEQRFLPLLHESLGSSRGQGPSPMVR
jgi:hypothetical protein